MMIRRSAGAVALLVCSGFGVGCRPTAEPPPRVSWQRAAPVDSTALLQSESIGEAITSHPWIAHVNAVDLDQDGLLDVVACEAQRNEVVWIRQVGRGDFAEHVLADKMAAPVHVEPADMDRDGDLDLLVASMGFVFPNNDRIGTVFILENDGRQNFSPRAVLTDTARVTDVRAADFNADGQLDLAVAQFGYDQGEVRWMERTGPWRFKSHVLLELSGAINVCVDDFNADGRPDIVALISQQWEEVYYFENTGSGAFSRQRIWGSSNEDYGSSGISVCDLNGDGRPDILYTNGDGFGPAALPGPRPWHGVQWFENAGHGFFRYHRIGDLPGAYSPVGVDLDRDGAMDIVASSAYADWDGNNPDVVSLMWFRNDGRMDFSPQVLARAPKDLISVTAGNFGGSEHPELVTGGFYVAAPYERMGRITLWRHSNR